MMNLNLLARLQDEIASKQEAIAALEGELAELRRAATVARSLPEESLVDLEATARLLLRLAGNAGQNTNGKHATLVPADTGKKADLAGKRIMEATEAVLKDLPDGQPMRHGEILRAAQARGFTSNRAGSDNAAILRSFYQTLASNARAEHGTVERTEEGLFRLRAKVKADEG